MKKGKKSILKRITITVLALALCFGTVPAVFAASEQTGTETAPATASLVKYVKASETDLPSPMNFEFKFEKISYNGGNAASDLDNMPAVANQTAAMTGTTYTAEATGVSGGYYKEVAVGGNNDTIESALVAKGAGLYVYKVTEDQAASYKVADAAKEELTYSSAAYYVTYQVVNGDSGAYIKTIAVTQADPTAQLEGGDGTLTDKVDPTPGSLTSNGFKFENVYARTQVDPGDDPDPTKAAFYVKKTATGDAANKAADAGFTFTVQIDLPSNLKSGSMFKTTYKAQIVNADGTAITGNSIFDVDLRSGTATITGKAINHDQKLIISGLPDGTTYTVTETDAKGHTPTYVATTKGVAAAAANATEGTAISEQTIKASATGANGVEMINTKTAISITGIVVDNLPYIGILLLALGGFAAYIVSRKRRRQREAQ